MLRLTGGEFRGRMIQTLKTTETRPTQAKLRQALFNSIQIYIPEAKVLDLFAGSGALGFEALSRGASRVVFVEDSRAAAKIIEKNAKELKVEDRVEILVESVDRVAHLLKPRAPFDLALADPPYAAGWEPKLFELIDWTTVLNEDCPFCLEWGTQKSQVDSLPDQVGQLVKTREKHYGDSVLTTYLRRVKA